MKDIFYMLKWKNELCIEDLINILKEKNMLPNTLTCPECGNIMVIHRDSSRKDHFRWVCKGCRKRRPLRINTWASKYRIPFIELYTLIGYYIEEVSSDLASYRLGLNLEIVEGFYEDLDALQPQFQEKMCHIIDSEITNPEFITRLDEMRNNFRRLSKVFTFTQVYDIILETLHENNGGSNGEMSDCKYNNE